MTAQTYWDECWDCGGARTHDDECACEAVADFCICETPTPAMCRTCMGQGGWTIDLPAEEST